MNCILKRYIIIVFLFGLAMMFSRCIYIGALVMSIDQKTTIDKWESGRYKTRIQRRIGWAGPHYYHCRIKAKTLGGLYYRTIVKETFSREDYTACILRFPVHEDTISVNVCNKNTNISK